MWTATVDFTKAFDSITHKSIWDALKSCNINHDYISLLKKIFRDQKASVQTDEESNIFEIRKGTKQGDPLSSLLFTTVLQYSLKDDIQRWQKNKGMGKYLSDNDHECLTNLRFADDVVLLASSKNSYGKCCVNSRIVLKKVGLRIHPEKTKNLSNQSIINSDTKKVCYAAGTWAPNKEHERMIQSTQRKMLRLMDSNKKGNTKRLRNKILGTTKKLKKLTSMK